MIGRKFRVTRLWVLIAAVLVPAFVVLAWVNVSPVLAQAPTPHPVTDDDVNAVAKQLYCPVCENIPLDVCPTQACKDWREEIRLKLSQGWTEAQIKQYFVDRFGDRVLAEPPARGFNWLVYVIPPIAILAGALILYRAMQGWKQSTPSVASTPGPASTALGQVDPSDEYVKKLEEALRTKK